jgi:hypothetical protein
MQRLRKDLVTLTNIKQMALEEEMTTQQASSSPLIEQMLQRHSLSKDGDNILMQDGSQTYSDQESDLEESSLE